MKMLTLYISSPSSFFSTVTADDSTAAGISSLLAKKKIHLETFNVKEPYKQLLFVIYRSAQNKSQVTIFLVNK